MKTTNYTIDFAAGTIEITKKFAKAAGIMGSHEYKEMITLRKDFPDFKIIERKIEKKENKKSYKGLTIKEMDRFVSNRTEEEVNAFNAAKELIKARKGSYASVKKWFLDRYKEDYKNELNEVA